MSRKQRCCKLSDAGYLGWNSLNFQQWFLHVLAIGEFLSLCSHVFGDSSSSIDDDRSGTSSTEKDVFDLHQCQAMPAHGLVCAYMFA